MKTKVNKVPLVGPRGRRELLDRIEELEKKVEELASSKPKQITLKDIGYPGVNEFSNNDREDFGNNIGLTEEQLIDIFNKKVDRIVLIANGGQTSETFSLTYIYEESYDTVPYVKLVYGAEDYEAETKAIIIQQNEDATYYMGIQNI